MGDHLQRGMLARTVTLVCLILFSSAGMAQKTVAVPKLDFQRYLTTWHVQEWLPNKAEKRCTANVVVLYAVDDKPNSFQLGTFCQRENGSTEEWTSTGRQDKESSGKLKLRKLVIFSSAYWVLEVDPEYRWALVGTPNHTRLWILSKAATVSPELLAEIEKKAAAQGFDQAKLVKTGQSDKAL